MFESGQEAIPNVREWSRDPLGCPGVMGGPLGCPGVVGGPPGSLGVVGGPPGCPEVVWMPSRMSGSGRQTLPNVPKWWETLLHVRQLSGGTPKILEALLDVWE